MNSEQWAGGKHCGRCVQATCVDERCHSDKVVVAYVADLCPECSYGDLDFGMPIWDELTGMTPDRVKIQWKFTSCAPYIEDTIQVSCCALYP